jgi:FixJ family two-component response regulator
MANVRRPVVAVVDNDVRVLESLENFLESAGYAVRLFSSAEALLDQGGLSEIDCLITDIGIPVIDGFELQRRAKAARPDLPVILITGRDEPGYRQRASAEGCHRMFRKPFDGHALLAAISDALGGANRET